MIDSATAPHSDIEANGHGQREPVLSVRDLWIEYQTAAGPVRAVSSASFDLDAGESIALIGESGSGKTTLGVGLLRLLPRSGRTRGKVQYRRATVRSSARPCAPPLLHRSC